MSSSPSQSSIQTLINACVTGANYPATKMNPVLTFSNQNFNITNIDPTLTDDYSGGYINLKSFWFNTSSQRVFICVDDTVGGAVWIDITPNPVNPDAASIIDITRADLSNEIINGTVDPKAIYRITDAESGTSVMRVYGITTSTIDTNAFKEGDWDGFNFVAGEVGTYDLGTDTFASVINTNAAFLINTTVADLQISISNGTVIPKAQYRITDAEGSLSVIRVYGITTLTIDTNAFKEGEYDGSVFTAGEIGLYDLGTDTFISIANPNAATVINTTQLDLSNDISNNDIIPKAQYRITDAIGSTAVVRVYGISSGVIDTNAFKEGSWDGANFVAGEIGLYDLGGDVFTSQAPNLQQVLDTGNTANGYTLNISGAPNNNISITDVSYTGTGNVGFGDSALNSNSANNNIGIGFAALQGNSGATSIALGYLSGSGNEGIELIALGTQSARDNEGDRNIAIGYAAGKENLQNDNIFIGYEAGINNEGFNNTAIGYQACKLNEGNFAIAIGDSAAESNTGDFVLVFGNKSRLNAQSNRFIIDNDYLPSFANHAAAAAAITVPLGAIAGNTYLYHNQATDSIGAVRL
jgi:hypothetical protein